MAAPLFQAIRGMHDLLPSEAPRWQTLTERCHHVASRYAYEQLQTPLVEPMPLFQRSVGEATDIVEKEMYVFDDRNGDTLCLRPEGTASCVRACIEHGLAFRQPRRLWYQGPMFRHERPQKGRYRQFHQWGVEALGMAGVGIELELLSMGHELWQHCGLDDAITLRINHLGGPEARAAHREALLTYLNQHKSSLDPDSQRRLTSNPLRIFDSKHPTTQALLDDAPPLMAFLTEHDRANSQRLHEGLEQLGIPFLQDQRLVRGLDYYTGLVFEWTTDHLGAQATVCAGGRYDGLVATLGGHPTPAVGMALGLERLMLLHAERQPNDLPSSPQMVCLDQDDRAACLLAQRARQALHQHPNLRIQADCMGGKTKKQWARARKQAATWVLTHASPDTTPSALVLTNLTTGLDTTCTFNDLPNLLLDHHGDDA